MEKFSSCAPAFVIKHNAGGSVKGRGNQSFLRTAVKAAGYADGSRSPSTGRILSMAEQARSSGRYRESGQDGLEELVINGYGYVRLVSDAGELWNGKLSPGR